MQDGRFPAIEPYDSGMLDVGDGHQVYWECCGNPAGKPALYLHGGPGSLVSSNRKRHTQSAAKPIALAAVHPSHNVSLLLTQTTEPIGLVANVSKRNLLARWPYHENKNPLL